MGRRYRLISAGKVKLLFWAAIIAGLWRVYQNDEVMNAILAFLFVGAIPGSRRSLSPDAVIRAVEIAIAVVLMSTVAWLIIRHVLKARRLSMLPEQHEELPKVAATEVGQQKEAPQPEQLATKQSMSFPVLRLSSVALPKQLLAVAQPTVAKGYKRSKKAAKVIAQNTKAVAPGVAATAVNAVWRWALRPLFTLVGGAILLLWRVAHFIVLTLVFVAQWTAANGRLAFVSGWQAFARWSVWFVDAIRVTAVALWRWLAPYLWKLDGWLERRTRATIAWSRKKAKQNDDVRFVLDTGRRTAKMVQNHKVFVALSNAKQRSRKSKKT